MGCTEKRNIFLEEGQSSGSKRKTYKEFNLIINKLVMKLVLKDCGTMTHERFG
jgi:hypothetical protein